LTTRRLDWKRDGARARATLQGALGLGDRAFVLAEQVHGPRVVTLAADPRERVPGADGLATRSNALALVALGADCPGVALLSDDPPAIAVAHSGWRGTVADVAPHAVEALVSLGARRETLAAWIGPGIGPCCFEVGDEVVAAFEAAHGPLGTLVSRPRTKAHIDLAGAIARRLVDRAGLRRENVLAEGECTRCATERFFSYRREGPGCGHHAVVAWIDEGRP
jgi:YfiH family protein